MFLTIKKQGFLTSLSPEFDAICHDYDIMTY